MRTSEVQTPRLELNRLHRKEESIRLARQALETIVLVEGASGVILGIDYHGYSSNMMRVVTGTPECVTKEVTTEPLALVALIKRKPPDQRRWEDRITWRPLGELRWKLDGRDLTRTQGVKPDNQRRLVVRDQNVDDRRKAALLLSCLIAKVAVQRRCATGKC